MQIILNGHIHDTPEGSTLLSLMAQLGHAEGHVAVAIDQVIIKRSAWAETPLHEGNKILIIGAVKGG